MPTPTPLRTTVRSAVAALALAAGLMMTACTASAPEPSKTPVADVNGLPSGVQQATSVPTDVANTPGLRQNVKVAACTGAKDGWKAEGTAKNPGEKDKDYTITVFFTTDHGTVLGTGTTTVTVPAGATTDWTVTSTLTPAPKTLCVLRGVA